MFLNLSHSIGCFHDDKPIMRYVTCSTADDQPCPCPHISIEIQVEHDDIWWEDLSMVLLINAIHLELVEEYE